MRVDGVFTRAGIFVYRNPDGSERRELRPPEEVFRKDSLASFELVPVTDDHPPEMITPKNKHAYERGHTQEGVRKEDRDLVVGPILVTDRGTINKVETGKVALSCGYEVDLDETAGEHPIYGRYDAVQRNIRGNHLAFVDVARAGPEARVRMDAAVQKIDVSSRSGTLQGANMADVNNLQGLLDAATAEVGNLKARCDKLERDLNEANSRADKAEGTSTEIPVLRAEIERLRKDVGEVDSLRNEVKALTDKLTKQKERADAAESPDRLAKAVRKRVLVEAAAARILPDVRVDQMSDRDIMLAVLEHTGRDVAEAKERSDDYVEARFDEARNGFEIGERALASIREIAERNAEQSPNPKRARQDMIDRNRNPQTKDGK